jgi:hypothetical protein
MNINIDGMNSRLNDSQRHFPKIAGILAFFYEYNHLKKTQPKITGTSWLLCLGAAGISFGLTKLMISNFEDLVDSKTPIIKKPY